MWKAENCPRYNRDRLRYLSDNAGTHKTKLIRNWFAKRPRWHVHFTPTSASWISLVERFFALLTDKQLRRGVYRSTHALEAAIHAYIDAHNSDPQAVPVDQIRR